MISIFFVAIFVSTVYGQQGEVAFSAGLDHNVQLLHAEKVVYNKIFTNVGAGYDSTSGNFNCPASGIYMFHFNILADQDKSTWLELYQNAYYVASAFGHSSNDYAAGGNSVILQLTKGDQVYIKAVDPTYGYNTNLYGATDEIYGTFSGYLISKLDQVIPAAGK